MFFTSPIKKIEQCKRINDESLEKMITELKMEDSKFTTAFVSFSNYAKLTVKNIRNIEIKAMSGIMENEVDFA
jgi:hypothetical protein